MQWARGQKPRAQTQKQDGVDRSKLNKRRRCAQSRKQDGARLSLEEVGILSGWSILLKRMPPGPNSKTRWRRRA